MGGVAGERGGAIIGGHIHPTATARHEGACAHVAPRLPPDNPGEGLLMAKRKSAKANNHDSAATLGFEAKLWQAADALRNNMDAAEYKHVVLGLILLKYIFPKVSLMLIPAYSVHWCLGIWRRFMNRVPSLHCATRCRMSSFRANCA